MRELGRVAVLFTLLAAVAPSLPADIPQPAGLGTLEAREPRGGSSHPLALVSVKVEARPAGDQAETRVEHVFRNDTEAVLEGTFRFPLPEGAIVTGLAMEMNGRLEEGELLEREEARRTYQGIVDRMRDPALLEWTGGRSFELRVFPIEPMSDKRVVLRYLAPLAQAGQAFSYVFPLAGLLAPLPTFRLDFDGRTIVEASDYQPGSDVVVALPRAPAEVLQEVRPEGLFTAVRLRPDWSRLPQAPWRGQRRLLVLLDVSRSMLEAQPLALQALEALLRSLGPDDRLRLVTLDIAVGDAHDHFVPATAANVAAALELARAIEPDGASDLGAALRHAGRLLAELPEAERAAAQVVYVGDGLPTWGETDEARLVALARESLAGASFFGLALGRKAETSLLARVAQALGGRVEAPRELAEVERFAAFLRAARPVLRQARWLGAEALELLPREPQTLFQGDEVTALLRTSAGQALPAALVLVGESESGPLELSFPLAAATPARQVARRWAAREIERLEASAAAQAEVVRVSLTYGVLSRHTAFLVLEPEEKQRRKWEAEQAADPAVSGRDLESLDAEAALAPDHIQPGDPEVRVSAPADARSVVVLLPTGETRLARYEPALAAWTVRFLIPVSLPAGRYEALIRITHHDGRLEIVRAPFTVDVTPPQVELSLRRAPGRPGTFEIVATQQAEVALPAFGDAGTRAEVRPDARRVSVRTPEGRVIELALVRDGLFRGYWTPRRPPAGPVSLRVVAVDRALNPSVREVQVELEAPAPRAAR